MWEQKQSSFRVERVCRQIQEEVAFILKKHVSDPRLKRVTVTQVEWNKVEDCVKIGVCRLPDNLEAHECQETEVLRGLKTAKAFIFEKLRKRLSLRRCPDLFFYYDDSIDKAASVWKTMSSWNLSPEPLPSSELSAKGSL